jgi:hypothetical protein
MHYLGKEQPFIKGDVRSLRCGLVWYRPRRFISTKSVPQRLNRLRKK